MKIPFLDLKHQYLALKPELDRAVLEALSSGWYVLGKAVASFERTFADYLSGEAGQGFVTGCNSGTDALVLAMKAAGVKPGDEVITVANTAIPTIAAICSIGAVPVFADIDEETWLIDPSRITACITPHSRAIIPVHLYGNMADMDAVCQIASRHGLKVIEDVAQACGASCQGRKAGTIGDFGAFSFYPSKNLGAMGDGGAIFCKKSGDAETLKMLRFYGQKDHYHAQVPGGVNSRLDELQAAILSVKLKHLESWNLGRATVRAQYEKRLGSLEGGLVFPKTGRQVSPAWHLMAVQLRRQGAGRDDFVSYMASQGVQLLVHYPLPAYRQLAFRHLRTGPLPVTERHCQRTVSLPLGHYLKPGEVDFVCDAAEAYFTRSCQT